MTDPLSRATRALYVVQRPPLSEADYRYMAIAVLKAVRPDSEEDATVRKWIDRILGDEG